MHPCNPPRAILAATHPREATLPPPPDLPAILSAVAATLAASAAVGLAIAVLAARVVRGRCRAERAREREQAEHERVLASRRWTRAVAGRLAPRPVVARVVAARGPARRGRR